MREHYRPRTTNMDPFQTLPVPIMEYILKLLPDLPSLHSLHNASPTVASLLHEDGVAPVIIEAIISQSPPQIQFLIRTIALLQWCPGSGSTNAANDNPLPSSWDAFTSPYNQFDRGGRPIPTGYGDIHLPKSIPPSILCHILGLSTRVRQLTHACLHDMIARCMALEPMHLKTPRFQYRRVAKFEHRQRRPPGLPYQPVDSGTPSWAEEQRVARAVWRLVLFFELRDAVVVRGLLDWGEEDARRLRGLGAEEFWDGLLIGGERMELETAVKWMFPASTAPGNERLPLWRDSSSVSWGKWICCCPESRPATEEEWKDAEKCFNRFYSPGYAFGKQAIARLHSSPLRHVDFAVFRPYGFAIWDLKRMMALGFLESFSRDDVAQNPLLSESNLFFTWESILTKDQSEEVERKQREQWLVC